MQKFLNGRATRIICVLVVLFLLAACQEQGASPTPAPQSTYIPVPEGQSAAPQSTFIPVPQTPNVETERITFHVPLIRSTDDFDRRLSVINKLIAERGIAAELEYVQINLRLNPIIADEPLPVDFVLMGNDTGAYPSFVHQGRLADLTDVLTGRTELVESIPEWQWREVTFDGRIYALPLPRAIDEKRCVHHTGMYIRKDILEELDMALPTTIEELMEVAFAARDKGLDYKIGYIMSNTPFALHRTYGEWPIFVDRNQLFIYDAKGNVSAYPGSDVYMKDMEILHRLYEEGLLLPYADSGEANTAQNGKWNFLATFNPGMPLPGMDHPLREQLVPFQFEPERENYNTSLYDWCRIVVNAQSKNPGLVMEVMELIYTDQEVYDAFVYGQKGVDWMLSDNGSYSIVKANTLFPESGYGHRTLARPSATRLSFDDDFFAPEGTYIDMPAARFNMIENYDLLAKVTRGIAYNDRNNYIYHRTLGTFEEATKAVENMLNSSYYALLDAVAEEYAEYVR